MENSKTPVVQTVKSNAVENKTNCACVNCNCSNSSASPYTYAILQESNAEEYESWLYFIRYQGNEDALNHLQRQLQSVDWNMDDDLSCFDLELDYLVSENTAREMTKIDLNHYSFHRKFDGTLKQIDLGFKKGSSDSKKIKKAFKVLGYGRIEEFVDKEDVDPSDLVSDSDSDENDSDSSSSSSESEKEESKHKKGSMPKPSNRIEVPRFAKAKESKAKATKTKK